MVIQCFALIVFMCLHDALQPASGLQTHALVSTLSKSSLNLVLLKLRTKGSEDFVFVNKGNYHHVTPRGVISNTHYLPEETRDNTGDLVLHFMTRQPVLFRGHFTPSKFLFLL
jgi:hypothetical protein